MMPCWWGSARRHFTLHAGQFGPLPGVLDQPAVGHLYSGNFLHNEPGRGQRHYGRYAGFCLETKNLANSPNRADGGACIIRPGQPFKGVT